MESPFLSKFLYGVVIVIYAVRTLIFNGDWKSNFDVGYAWMRDYPESGRGYALLGIEYYNEGLDYKAKEYLEKSVLLGDKVPYDVLTLAKCYLGIGEYKAAEALLKQIISYYPDYADSVFCLGIVYYFQKHYQKSQQLLEKSVALNPKLLSEYELLLKVYMILNKNVETKSLLKRAEIYLNDKDQLRLHGFINRLKGAE